MIKVYSKANCPACEEAKSILKANGVDYQEVKIDQDQEAREFIISSGFRTVPQIHTGVDFIKNGVMGLKALSPEEIKSL